MSFQSGMVICSSKKVMQASKPGGIMAMYPAPCSEPFQPEVLREFALAAISDSENLISPGRLVRMIMKWAPVTRAQAKELIRLLADRGDIVYNNVFGSTYLEPSFLKPVSIADHYLLKPWHSAKTRNFPESLGTDERKIEIIISPGISFGSGSHPTTRLCLEAMAFLFFGAGTSDTGNGLGHHPDLSDGGQLITLPPGKSYVADVGTGSGILAVAAVKSGMAGGLAIDTDPNCVSEAGTNVKLNGLHHQIIVTDAPLDCNKTFPAQTGPSQNRFSLICANLRYPTLKKMSSTFRDSTEKKAHLILSGVREWESGELISWYQKKGFRCLWQRNEKKWSGMVFVRTIHSTLQI